jgi:hypothetical protein
MKTVSDRRSEPRILNETAVYLMWDEGDTPCERKAKLHDYSATGLSFRTRGRFPRGMIVWCAVPAYGVCSRARVAHSAGGWRAGITGIEFLAGPFSLD